MSSLGSKTGAKHGPLVGLKVLELSQIMAGPTCGLMLADLGADVIKVEKLPGGDDVRTYKDPLINGIAAPFLMLNRNKRSIGMNLKMPQAQAAFKKMVLKSDALTENYRKGTLEKMGLGYGVLKSINPGLIYCAISGYGRSGPMADKGGFDLIAQGFAGLMSITGEPGRPPIKTGNSVADINSGILACVGILAAYIEKLRTGQGQMVDTSLMEAGLQQTYWHAAIYFATGLSPQPTGSAHVLTAPYQAFKTADGYVNIGGANQANWERVAQVLNHPEWIEDERFKLSPSRHANIDQLAPLMEAELGKESTDYWVDMFETAGVPVGPVHSIGQALEHEQSLARDMIVEVDHPEAGRIRTLGNPIKLSNNRADMSRPAPSLGQHSREILREFEFLDGDIDDLLASGAVN
jgi:crotonobetainyl-CoA:carnitine CoA-transferase CaiB-like acyl-CoA transferase